MTKKQDKIMETLVSILTKLNKIEAKTDENGERLTTLETVSPVNDPEFHSLNKTEVTVKKRNEEVKKALDPKLDKAVDMAILHFKKEPPERRVT